MGILLSDSIGSTPAKDAPMRERTQKGKWQKKKKTNLEKGDHWDEEDDTKEGCNIGY